MDDQLPIDDIRQVTVLLSEASLARIEVVRAEQEAQLLSELCEFWPISVAAISDLERLDYSKLIPFFEKFAEPQFDAYAREMLPHFASVDHYALHLSIHIMDEISNQIRPQRGLFTPSPIHTRDWSKLLVSTSNPDPEIKEHAIATLYEIVSDPHVDWESFVGMSLERHWPKNGFKEVNGRFSATKADQLRLILDLKYRFPLRLFLNWHDFDRRLRAHLLPRLGFWTARAYRRLADVQGALSIDSETASRSPVGVPDILSPGDFVEGQPVLARGVSAVPVDKRGVPPVTTQFPTRARWLENELAIREWSVHDLQAQGGPDWKTGRKILNGLSVSRVVLEKTAAALSKKKARVTFTSIPQE